MYSFCIVKFNQMMRSYILPNAFNPGAKFVILFINPNVRSTNTWQNVFAHKLFRLMYDRYNAANVMLICATSGSEYNIYVTNPYQNKTQCGTGNNHDCLYYFPFQIGVHAILFYNCQAHYSQFYWTHV